MNLKINIIFCTNWKTIYKNLISSIVKLKQQIILNSEIQNIFDNDREIVIKNFIFN